MTDHTKKFPVHKSHCSKYHINPSTVFVDFQNIQSLGSALYTEEVFRKSEFFYRKIFVEGFNLAFRNLQMILTASMTSTG